MSLSENIKIMRNSNKHSEEKSQLSEDVPEWKRVTDALTPRSFIKPTAPIVPQQHSEGNRKSNFMYISLVAM